MGRSKVSGPPAGAPGPGNLDQRWHLAATPHEVNVTELEFALMRVRESFERWQGECFAAASGLSASGSENALLHTIRLHERAKPLKELARLTNRDDVPNMQYALRKLTKLGLIEQIGNRSNAVYQVTAKGREVSDLYAELRRRHLIEFTQVVKDMDQRLRQTTQTLNLLSGIYEQAARVTATHQRFADGR
jgi:predicted MarR family transcription regulator